MLVGNVVLVVHYKKKMEPYLRMPDEDKARAQN